MYSIPTESVIHTTHALRNPKGSFQWMCHGLHWPTTSYLKRQQAHANVYLFANFVSNHDTLKSKMAVEVSMAYIKEILLKILCSKFILQDNGTEFKNDQLISVFDTLGIKGIYSNPYYPQGNGRIENIQNFLKCTIAKFTYGSPLKWDHALPLATYCYNVTL